jgi:hypothetical protein
VKNTFRVSLDSIEWKRKGIENPQRTNTIRIALGPESSGFKMAVVAERM